MSVRIYWNPSEEEDIHSYRIERSTTSAVGTYSTLATVLHAIPGANYDAGRFFYDDVSGLSTYWYRLVAIDTGTNESAPSPPFQAVSSETPNYEVVQVDIYVDDGEVSPTYQEDVNIGIFDPVTLAPMAFGLTNSDGRAAFLLLGSEEGTEYEVRLYKLGLLFGNPFSITVLAPLPEGQTNRFDVSGELTTLPVSSDPRTCKCTGRFMDLSNNPIVGALLRVSAKGEFQNPKMVDGNLIPAEALTVKTDSNGKISIDLIRGGEFYVSFSGEEDQVWNIKVPDRSSVNLIDLIHPKPVLVNFEDETVSLTVSELLEVPVTVTFSDYEVIEEDLSLLLEAVSSDEDVVLASLSGSTILLTGVAAGSATVSIAVKEGFLPNMIPDPSGTTLSPTLAVTVS